MKRLYLVSLIACGFLLFNCGEDSEETSSITPIDPGRTEFIESVYTKVIQPQIDNFEVEATNLSQAIQTYVGALNTSTASSAQQTVNTAFASAADSLQRLEILQLGPYAKQSLAGGQAIRDNVYSWPTTSTCQVDREVAKNEFGSSSFFQRRVDVFGFDALEYLLFNNSTEHTCSFEILGWNELVQSNGLTARRLQYAARLAENIVQQAQTLTQSWTDGFSQQFRVSGNNSVYRDSQEVVEAVFAAIFYLDKQVKDDKIGTPTGIHPNCAQNTCPNNVESRFAQRSLENIKANLEAFQLVFHGGDPSDSTAFGFDDLLNALNSTEASDLANSLTQRIAQMRTAADAVSPPFVDALDSTSAAALHESIKQVTDLLKNQFVTILAIKLPDEGAADND